MSVPAVRLTRLDPTGADREALLTFQTSEESPFHVRRRISTADAARRVFVRAGWVQEAHHREAWPVNGGPAVGSVGDGVLRRDWETGETTPVPWDDVAR